MGDHSVAASVSEVTVFLPPALSERPTPLVNGANQQQQQQHPLAAMAETITAMNNALLAITAVVNQMNQETINPQLRRKKICWIRVISLFTQTGELSICSWVTICAVNNFINKNNVMGGLYIGCAIFSLALFGWCRREMSKLERKIDPNRKNNCCEKLFFSC